MKNTTGKVTLYICTHNKTGMKYFGKTTKYFTEEDLQKYYHGSGKYWLNHLRVHGDDVTMEIYGIYNLDETADDYVKPIALKFSEDNNIVKALNESGDRKGKKIWANINPENGLDGGYNRQAVEANKLASFVNENGHHIRTNKNDKRVLSGEYVSINKGTKPSISNNMAVSKANKGKSVFKDENGNIIRTNIDDERVISGELKGIQSGVTYSKDAYNSRRGKVAHNAYNIIIMDRDGNVMFECKGNFAKTCKKNDLPFKALTKSYKDNNPLYLTDYSLKRTKEKYKKYRGWRAVKVDELT